MNGRGREEKEDFFFLFSSPPLHPLLYTTLEFDPEMVGKGVLVCCMTSLRKWSIALSTLVWGVCTCSTSASLTFSMSLLQCIGIAQGGVVYRPKSFLFGGTQHPLIALTGLGPYGSSHGAHFLQVDSSDQSLDLICLAASLLSTRKVLWMWILMQLHASGALLKTLGLGPCVLCVGLIT